MTIDRLLELAATTPILPYECRRFAFRDGLRILFEFDEEYGTFECTDGTLCYGYIHTVANKMREEDVIRLFRLGWGICKDRFCISQYS